MGYNLSLGSALDALIGR